MSIRSANGSQQFLAGEVPELTFNLVTSPLTLTAQAAADGFVLADNSYIWRADLAGMRQVRLTGLLKTVSASAGTPRLQLRYAATATQVVASYLQLGQSVSVSVSLFTGQLHMDTGWVDLAELAKINGVYLGLMSIGGDGVAAPVVNCVSAQFR